jgi:hypothetical protein
MSDSIVVNGLPSIIAPNPTFFSFGNGGGIKHGFNTELITIPVGSGQDPYVLSASYMVPINADIIGLVAYVVTAPGGGAATFNIYTNPGAEQLYANPVAVAAGAKTPVGIIEFAYDESVASSPTFCTTAAQKLEIRTDADVTVSNMVLRVGVYWIQYVNFTS